MTALRTLLLATVLAVAVATPAFASASDGTSNTIQVAAVHVPPHTPGYVFSDILVESLMEQDGILPPRG